MPTKAELAREPRTFTEPYLYCVEDEAHGYEWADLPENYAECYFLALSPVFVVAPTPDNVATALATITQAALANDLRPLAAGWVGDARGWVGNVMCRRRWWNGERNA